MSRIFLFFFLFLTNPSLFVNRFLSSGNKNSSADKLVLFFRNFNNCCGENNGQEIVELLGNGGGEIYCKKGNRILTIVSLPGTTMCGNAPFQRAKDTRENDDYWAFIAVSSRCSIMLKYRGRYNSHNKKERVEKKTAGKSDDAVSDDMLRTRRLFDTSLFLFHTKRSNVFLFHTYSRK